MKSFVFITVEGYTFQPNSESLEPDIENCQVIGFAQGKNDKEAFNNLIQENSYLLYTTFDKLICLELKEKDYFGNSTYFHLDEYRQRNQVFI